MAIPAQFWYCGSTKYTAVAQWTTVGVHAAGDIVRQITATPAVGSERCFVCIIAGTSLVSEPNWVTTKGAKTAEAAGPTWMECTGRAGLNGDLTNTSNWTAVKNTAVALGQVIQRNSAGSLQICTTAGTTGNSSEPAFSNTAGTTTADNTVTWTSLGAPGNFGAYAAPWARLNLALATGFFIAAGDTVYVSNNHAETQASAITYTTGPGGSIATLTQILCVSDTVVPPTALATTATVSTTGANALSVGGSAAANMITYGISYLAGDGANTANLVISQGLFDNVIFKLNNTSASSLFNISGAFGGGVAVFLKNCQIIFGSTSQKSTGTNQFIMVGGSIALTGSAPSTLFIPSAYNGLNVSMRDVDLSGMTGTLFNVSASGGGNSQILNCSLGSGVTPVSGTFTGNPGTNYALGSFKLHNCDSAATNYRYLYYLNQGSVQQETTIVRTGGASDGTTPISWNIATSATAINFYNPLITEEIAQWQDTTGGSKTATIELTTNSSLNNNDCWVEIEYLGASGSPLGSVATSRMTPLGTPTPLTTSSTTWGGGALTNKYKISVPFTPQMKGPIKARIYVAKPSITVYVDPLITVT